MSRHIVVIGAGAIGVMSAIACLREGFAVTVVEPGEPGGDQAASFGNGAWLSSHSVIPPSEPGLWKKVPHYLLDPTGPLALRPSYLPRATPWLLRYLLSGWTAGRVERTARALRPLLVGAPGLHAEIAAEAGARELIEDRSGLMHVYPSRAAFGTGGIAWEIRRKVGIAWTELEGEALREAQPDLSPRYGFALMIGEAGYCRDPGAYVARLAAHARARGANFVKADAKGFRVEDGRLKAVIVDGGEVACDGAVIAAGVWSKPLARAAGDTVPLDTERGYHVEIPGVSIGPRASLMVSDLKMVVTLGDRGLRGAGQVEIAGLKAAPNWKRAEILKDHLLGLFPALPRDLPPEAVRFWMGHRPSMPDGKPCLGTASRCRDIVHAFGHGHVGLVSSARTGRVVAELLAGREPEIPIAPFDPRRF